MKNEAVFEQGNISFSLPSIKVYPSHKKTQQNPNLATFLKLKENNFGFEILNNDYLLGISEDGGITLMRRKEFILGTLF